MVKITKPNLVICFLFAWLVGIFLAEFLIIDFWWVNGMIIGLLVGLIIFWRDKNWRLILLIVIGLLGGLNYYHFWDTNEARKIVIYDKEIEFSGQIIDKPERESNKQTVILSYEIESISTKIIIELPRYPEYKYGDSLTVKGKIQNPYKIKTVGNFDYGHYLLKRGIRGLMKNPEIIAVNYSRTYENNLRVQAYRVIYQIGEKFELSVNRFLPEPYAALQNGLITGTRSNFSDSLMSAFNRSGTTHIIAVSGYNVTIVISVITILLAGFSRKLAFWGSIGIVISFVILTGASASVVRAGILAILVSWGKTEGRRTNHTILILLVAVLMLLFNPYALLSDISFQLSFLAFIGLVSLAPKLSDQKINFLPSKIKTILMETISAQIMVLPILLYNFGTLSIIAPLTNILILPFIPVIMFSGIALGIFAMVWEGLARIIASLNWLVLRYIILVVEHLSDLSWAAVGLEMNQWWWIPLYYILIFIWLRHGLNKAESSKIIKR